MHRQFLDTLSKRTLTNQAMQPRIADGEDADKLVKDLSALIESGWQLDEDESGVRKIYHLKTYTKVLVRFWN